MHINSKAAPLVHVQRSITLYSYEKKNNKNNNNMPNDESFELKEQRNEKKKLKCS